MSVSVKPVTHQYIGEYENIAAQDECLDVAGGWQKFALGDLTEWSSGGTPPKNNPEFWDGDIPWISASSMKTGHLSESDRTLTPEGLKQGSRLAKKGNVLLLVRGSELHKRIPVGIAVREVSFNQDVKALCAKNGLDKNFLYFWLSGNEQMLLSKVENTGIGAGKLDTNVLKNLPILLPPLPEQRRIAHVLGTLDDKIENNRKTAKTLEAMAQAIFQSWFVDFDPVRAKMAGESRESICKRLKLAPEILDLFPDRLVDSELGEIPEGWRVGTFEDYANIVGGSTPSTSNPDFWIPGIHGWATPKDLANLKVPVLLSTEHRVTEAGLQQISSRLLPAGTVLLSSRAPIGYVAITETPVAINQGFIALKLHNLENNIFIMLLIKHNMDEIISRANGSTFLEVSKAKFRPIPVISPAQAILRFFAKLVIPLFLRIASLEKFTRMLTIQRDTLLPKLISGELRVDAAKELVSEDT